MLQAFSGSFPKVQERNNVAGGFPATSFGSGGSWGKPHEKTMWQVGFPPRRWVLGLVSGTKQHGGWISRHIVRCWGGFRASTRAHELAGGFPAASCPLPSLPVVTHAPLPILRSSSLSLSHVPHPLSSFPFVN
jgi:hypothetical protein